MSLTNLHTIATHQDYVLLRDLEIKRAEDAPLLAGNDLSGLGPKEDQVVHNAVIGYGIDFRKNTPTDIQAWYQQANLSAYLTPSDFTLMTNYHTNPTSANLQALINSFTHLPDEPAAARLLTAAVDAREAPLNARLGFVMLESNERAALMSMFYNGGAGIIGPKLLFALQNDNRAEAWYEIRYDSNGGASSGAGIASRRYGESDKFGLFGNVQTNEAEAKSIYQMYTAHRETILDYEAHFSPTAAASRTFHDESVVARNLLITTYASEPVPFGSETVALPGIDGEVLVGKDAAPALALFETLKGSSKGDLILGEGGMDQLEGGSGTDVLYGGAGSDTLLGGSEADVLFGNAGFDRLKGGSGEDVLFGGEDADILIGGSDNDQLAGGAGHDLYYYNTGDGVNQIEDSDADGVIFVNGQMLAGGVKQSRLIEVRCDA